MDNQSELIEFRVVSLSQHKKNFLKELFKKSNEFLLVLEQKEKPNQQIIMVIGKNDSYELAIAIEEIKTTRPLPSEILKTVIIETGFNLSKVIIDDLKEGIFYSKMILTKDQETKIIDCRPVDAITQSFRFNCGIYLTKKVIDEYKK